MHSCSSIRIRTRIMLPLSCCLMLLLFLHVADQRPNSNDHPARVITFSPDVMELLGKRDEEDVAETVTALDVQKPLGPPPMRYQCEDNWSLDNLRPKYIPDMQDHLWVDDVHGLIYCGSESELSHRILYLLARLNYHRHHVKLDDITMDIARMSKYRMKPLSFYSDEEIEARLSAYTTVLGIQHPLDRLYATFQNEKSGVFSKYKQFSKLIGNKYIEEKFAEFVDYLVKKSLETRSTYEPVHVACRPCLVTYDVVVRWENLREDLEHLIRFKQENSKYRMNKAEDVIQEAIFNPNRTETDIRLSDNRDFYDNMSKRTLDKLHNTYHMDFILFDYIKHHEEVL